MTTGDAEMSNLRKEKAFMSGPSGEIMESTHRGTILFPCGDLTIKFRDALVVPKLERNLLSLSRMLDSNPDLFVVFNKDRFEGFKGQLHGVGTTLFQGQKDSSNLFALLSNVDETKAIVSAEAEPVADVQVNDCVLNTVRKKNFVEDFASSDFSHVQMCCCPDLGYHGWNSISAFQRAIADQNRLSRSPNRSRKLPKGNLYRFASTKLWRWTFGANFCWMDSN